MFSSSIRFASLLSNAILSIVIVLVCGVFSGCAQVLLESDPTQYHIANAGKNETVYLGMVAHRVVFASKVDCVVSTTPITASECNPADQHVIGLLRSGRSVDTLVSALKPYEREWTNQPAMLVGLNPPTIGVLCDDPHDKVIEKHLCRLQFLRETGIHLVTDADLDRTVCKLVEVPLDGTGTPTISFLEQGMTVYDAIARVAEQSQPMKTP